MSSDARDLIKQLTNLQLGGETYGKLWHTYLSNMSPMQLNFSTETNEEKQYTLRNVTIHLSDRAVKSGVREKFNLNPSFKAEQIIVNTSNSVTLYLGDIRPTIGILLAEIKPEHYNDRLDFEVAVEAENFTFVQRMISLDINENPINYLVIKKSNGEILEKKIDSSFPLDKNGNPLRDK